MSIIKETLRVAVATVLTLGGGLVAIACSAEGSPEAANPSVTTEAVCSGSKFYGSDTLLPVIVAAATPKSLVYAGLGSGIGEAGLHGTGPCAPAKQLSAPMSRDLISCTSGADQLKSKRIGKDGILALTATSNTETSITKLALQQAFCSVPVPSGGACVSPLTLNGKVYSKFYRRDDASGTTYILKALLGCTDFCFDANHVLVTGRPPPCVPTDTETQCIAKLTQANAGAAGVGQFVLGYAGLSARTISGTLAKELNVEFPPAAPVAPTDANIHSGTYPLWRHLFVNYNATTLAAPASANSTLNEKRFLCENVLGPTFASGTNGCSTIPGLIDRRAAFENSLVSMGDFLKCSSIGGPFNCGPGFCL